MLRWRADFAGFFLGEDRMRLFAMTIAATGLVMPGTAAAQDRLSGEFGVSGLYDSHLSNDDVDASLEKGDFGARLDAEIKFQLVDKKQFELSAEYDFGQTLYFKYDEFNLQTHRFGADASTRIGGLRLGLGYDYMHVRLGGDALFNRQTVTPTLAGYVADRTFLRAYYTYLDKNFETQNGRDASGHEVGASLFRFFDDNAGFVSVRGSYETENAADPAYDFGGFLVGASSRIPLGDKKGGPKLRLGVNYRERNYDSITPSINEIRHETRWRGEASVEVPIKGGLRAEAEYRYTDRNSNFPASDYQEHRVQTGLFFEF